MCIPLWQFFVAVRDFKRSVREVKTNLSDIKSILNGTLAMSQELEEVTAEFRNITQFYSRESKNALRDQLCSSMSIHAHEALYHRDFFKHFKLTLEFEVNKLIEDHDKRTAQLAILDIIQHMKKVIKEWINTYAYDKLKTRLLIELTLYLQESFSQYICDDEDIWPNLNNKRRNSNIKTFCEKQNVIQTLECLIAEHFNRDIKESDFYSNNYAKGHDIIYRQRASRIRRFRKFLTSKIKIKKIGNYYREEISIQVNVDLKRASKETWELEESLRERCTELVQGLKLLPRHRFVDVLAEENVTNLGLKIADLTLKSFMPESMNVYGDKLQSVNLKVKSLLPKSKESFNKNEAEKKELTDGSISQTFETFHLSEDATCSKAILNEEEDENEKLTGMKTRDSESVQGHSPVIKSEDKLREVDENVSDLSHFPGEEFQLLVSMLESIPDVLCDNKQEPGINSIAENHIIVDTNDSNTNESGAIDNSKSLKGNSSKINADAIIKNISDVNRKTDVVKNLLPDEFLNTLKEMDIRRLFSKEMLVYALQRHQQILKFNEALGDISLSSTSESEIIKGCSMITSLQGETADESIVFDAQLIYDDIEHIIHNLLKVIGRKSARYTIELIDRSHVMTSKIIDFLSNIHALYQYDLTEEKCCNNIFLNKIIEILTIDLKEEEVNVIKNIIFAFTNDRENKLAFLKRLEQKLPATILKNLETVKGIKENRSGN